MIDNKVLSVLNVPTIIGQDKIDNGWFEVTYKHDVYKFDDVDAVSDFMVETNVAMLGVDYVIKVSDKIVIYTSIGVSSPNTKKFVYLHEANKTKNSYAWYIDHVDIYNPDEDLLKFEGENQVITRSKMVDFLRKKIMKSYVEAC